MAHLLVVKSLHVLGNQLSIQIHDAGVCAPHLLQLAEQPAVLSSHNRLHTLKYKG